MSGWLACSAVVFDLDDTLLDHRGAVRQALVHWARERELCGTPTNLADQWFDLERKYYPLFQARELTQQQQRRERIRSFVPMLARAPDNVLDEAFEEYWSHYRAHWRPFDDARAAVERAVDAGLVVGILSNGDHVHQSTKLETLDFVGPAVVFAASSNLSAAKPDPRAFEEMRMLIGVDDARECVMVGDSWENDVLGARTAGWQAVHLARQGTSGPLEPRVNDVPTITSLDELHFGQS